MLLGVTRAGYQSKPVSANAAYNTTGYQPGGQKGSQIGSATSLFFDREIKIIELCTLFSLPLI